MTVPKPLDTALKSRVIPYIKNDVNPLKDSMLGVCRSLVMERINRSDIRDPHISTKLLSNILSEDSDYKLVI